MRRIKYYKNYNKSYTTLIFSIAGLSIVIGLLPVIIQIIVYTLY